MTGLLILFLAVVGFRGVCYGQAWASEAPHSCCAATLAQSDHDSQSPCCDDFQGLAGDLPVGYVPALESVIPLALWQPQAERIPAGLGDRPPPNEVFLKPLDPRGPPSVLS